MKLIEIGENESLLQDVDTGDFGQPPPEEFNIPAELRVTDDTQLTIAPSRV